MYSLKEGWIAMFGEMPTDDWDGKIYCQETNSNIIFSANKIQGFLKAHTFALVLEGSLTIVYSGRKLTLQADDLYFYSPGMPITVLEASDNYRALILYADEYTTIDIPAVRDLVNIAYMPIVQLHEPKLSLSHDAAQRLASRMREISEYLHSSHIYRDEVLRMLYGVFLLDVRNAQKYVVARGRQVPQRVEEIFIGFVRLLPENYVEHRDLAFYASRLNISSVYLSRVVKQVSGRTVVDYINHMLLMEASFLLRTSSLSITQIADLLHFADTPSFSKFFSRLKGMSPREYRMEGRG